MARGILSALVVSLLIHAAHGAAKVDNTRVQLSPTGTLLRSDVGSRKHLAGAALLRQSAELKESSARAPFFSPLQIASHVSASVLEPDDQNPWPIRPLCQFEAQGDFNSLVRVFVNKDNTRAFVFDRDNPGAQTKIQCHGATPAACLKPNPSPLTGEPDNCENYDCSCVQTTLSLDAVHLHYAKQMIKKVGPFCSGDGGANILHIGLGGGAMSTYLLDNCAEGTRVTSVEKDPRIVKMAKKFFGFRVEAGRNEVENLDGGAAIEKHVAAGDRFDVVLIDCFGSHGHVPDSCSSAAFVQGIQTILRPGGVAIQQVWASQYSDLHHNYNEAFGVEQLSSEPIDGDLNYLIIAKPGK